jgi:antitoxin component of MazEF toxin-antitoxin module
MKENLKLSREYKVKRKLQEQSGSYFVILPKIWVECLGLQQGDFVNVKFNGEVKITPIEKQGEVKNNSI